MFKEGTPLLSLFIALITSNQLWVARWTLRTKKILLYPEFQGCLWIAWPTIWAWVRLEMTQEHLVPETMKVDHKQSHYSEVVKIEMATTSSRTRDLETTAGATVHR